MKKETPAAHITDRSHKIVLLPIGSYEQHGPYLPLDTDLRIAKLITDELAKRFHSDTLCKLPALPFSCSWEHKGPGMIALNVATLAAVIRDIAQSLKAWNSPCIFIMMNWHGGNSILSSLATEITATLEIPTTTFHTISEASTSWTSLFHEDLDTDVHAGMLETSIIQAYWPELIEGPIPQTADYVPAATPISIQTAIQFQGITSLTPQGIWGKPSATNPARGKQVLENVINNVYLQISKIIQLVEQKQKEEEVPQ